MSNQQTHDSATLHALLESAVTAARQAGDLVHERRNAHAAIDVQFKEQGLNNLVTEMDTAAEKLIKAILAERHPTIDFLGEEGGGNVDLNELTWVVDPIDGTVNYAHGIPIYCVSIAAVQGNQPLVGVIYNPNIGELFTAVHGEGAFLNGERMSVSSKNELEHAVLVTGFPYNVRENPYGCIDAFVAFLHIGAPIRRLGSAALDLAYLAAGRFDAYWEVALNPWDVAAGALMIQEAGGMVSSYALPEGSGSNPSGSPIITDRILATNRLLHQDMLEALHSVQRSGTLR